jgi:hypothetical protein
MNKGCRIETARHDPGGRQESSVMDLLFDQRQLLDWDIGPDRETLYSHAIRQLHLLATLCPDFGVRQSAAIFLAKEFAPKPPTGAGGWGEEEALAVTRIEAILRRRGISAPSSDMGEPLELEADAEGSFSTRDKDEAGVGEDEHEDEH